MRFVIPACCLLFTILLANEQPALEVKWKHAALFPAAGVTRAVVFDENICRVELLPDQIRVTGLARGVTLVVLWSGESRRTVAVRVTEPPDKRPPVQFRRDLDATNISGFLSTSATDSKAPGMPGVQSLTNRIIWQEKVKSGSLSMYADTIGYRPAVPTSFNLTTAAIEYTDARSRWSLMDSVLALGSLPAATQNPLSSVSSLVIRGIQFSRQAGPRQYTAFAGTTLPPWVLRLAGTGDIAGLRIDQKLSSRHSVFLTQAFTSVPAGFTPGRPNPGRRISVMATAGVSSQVSPRTRLKVSTGVSNRGVLLDGDLWFGAHRDSCWVSGRYASTDFPLNQLHLLTSGKLSATAGAQKLIGNVLDLSAMYQHTSLAVIPTGRLRGGTDYIHASAGVHLGAGQRASVSLSGTRSLQSLLSDSSAASTRGLQTTFDLSSRLGRRAANTFRIALGALRDPLQINSQSDLSIRDTLSLRLASFASLTFQVSRDRIDPVLVSRLSRNLFILRPALQELFTRNPAAFVDSPEMSPELRALLTSLRPGNLQGTVESQWRLGRRLDASVTLGQFLERETIAQRNRSLLYGFHVQHHLSDTLDLTASLSETWLYQAGELRRSRVATIGLNKRLSRSGRGLQDMVTARHSIIGRVFRDSNGSGTWNIGESPFPGIRVDLSNGATAVTDSNGRYRFSGLRASEYTITLTLGQFRRPVRVTTSVERVVDLTASRISAVDFGIIDRSRVRGNAFNDYLMTGRRQPDAPPLENVRIRLTSTSGTHEAVTTREGDFEFDGIEPGEYSVSVDRSTVPPDFQPALPDPPLRVASAQTANIELPFRALRSVSGRVVFRSAPSEPAVPLAGVRVTAGASAGNTDKNGAFLLRDLPAGEVLFAVVPHLPLPVGKRAPSGIIRLGRAPFSGAGMEIVISDPQLAFCVTSQAAENDLVAGPSR